MEIERKMEFNRLFAELIRRLTDKQKYDTTAVNEILAELCKMFRISRGETFFYEGLNEEREGKGEHLVCYDDGRDDRLELNKRVITPSRAVVIARVYMPEESVPLAEDERECVDLVVRSTLNVIARARLQRAVERLAFFDDSGFQNTRNYHRNIDRFDEQHALPGKAAFHYNLRHFSLVNQEIGKRAGDVVIRNHYEVLRTLIGSEGVVCRLGGDNFVGLCAKHQVDDVVKYLTETPVIYDADEGKRIMVSATAGFFPIPEDFVLHNHGELMDPIVSASAAARRSGVNQIVFYNDKLADARKRRLRVQQQFPDAMLHEEFKVYYQPKIDIETGRIAGAEALCRWYKDGRIVPPGDFIPVLEESSAICKLDFYMLEHVCMDIRRWLNEGRKVVRISVNFSRRHMMDVDLLTNIMSVIDRYRVPHQYLEVELTETTTDVEFKDLKRVVSGLQQEGICTSVDDFGIGYSSLNLIREIPWNVLKVDRSFLPVDDDDPTGTRSIMFKYVIAMAKALGLEVIAEGVETQAQVDVLRENHCMLAQGFFFDKPLPVEEFERRLDQQSYPIKR